MNQIKKTMKIFIIVMMLSLSLFVVRPAGAMPVEDVPLFGLTTANAIKSATTSAVGIGLITTIATLLLKYIYDTLIDGVANAVGPNESLAANPYVNNTQQDMHNSKAYQAHDSTETTSQLDAQLAAYQLPEKIVSKSDNQTYSTTNVNTMRIKLQATNDSDAASSNYVTVASGAALGMAKISEYSHPEPSTIKAAALQKTMSSLHSVSTNHLTDVLTSHRNMKDKSGHLISHAQNQEDIHSVKDAVNLNKKSLGYKISRSLEVVSGSARSLSSISQNTGDLKDHTSAMNTSLLMAQSPVLSNTVNQSNADQPGAEENATSK